MPNRIRKGKLKSRMPSPREPKVREWGSVTERWGRRVVIPQYGITCHHPLNQHVQWRQHEGINQVLPSNYKLNKLRVCRDYSNDYFNGVWWTNCTPFLFNLPWFNTASVYIFICIFLFFSWNTLPQYKAEYSM